MDPLTHTLLGANLAATRLGQKTRLAAAALVIGANLPDVDSILYFTGHQDLALHFRRGWTHGVLALVVLPFVQTALLIAYARWKSISVDRAWLLALSFLAILTHPALDWLNNYGMRWLMPFDGRWFYGDSVYIMDPWLWVVLGCGWLIGRGPTKLTVGFWIFFVVSLVWVVGRRRPEYLAVLVLVAIVLLIAILLRTRRSYAFVALLLAAAYVAARLGIHAATVAEVRRSVPGVERVMAAPHPLDPLHWDVVAETGDVYRYGRFHWRGRRLVLNPDALPVAHDSPEWRAVQRDPSIRGFVNWARFPWYEVIEEGDRTRVLVHDARYAVRRRAGGGFGGVEVILNK